MVQLHRYNTVPKKDEDTGDKKKDMLAGVSPAPSYRDRDEERRKTRRNVEKSCLESSLTLHLHFNRSFSPAHHETVDMEVFPLFAFLSFSPSSCRLYDQQSKGLPAGGKESMSTIGERYEEEWKHEETNHKKKREVVEEALFKQLLQLSAEKDDEQDGCIFPASVNKYKLIISNLYLMIMMRLITFCRWK